MNKFPKHLRLPGQLSAGVAALLVLVGAVMLASGNRVNASTVLPGKSVLTGNIASVPKAGETADGKYSVIAKVSAKTELKGLGSTSYLTKDTKAGDNVGTALHIDGSAPKGSAGALYTNIASMGGRSLDLAIVATDWSSQVATIQFRTKSIGVDLIPVGGDGTISPTVDHAAQFKFIYLDHETHKPVQVSGYYTFTDIDWGQSIGLTSDVWSHIDHMYVPTDKTILQYLKTDVGSFVFEPESSVGTSDDSLTSQVTFLYSGVTGMDMLFTSSGDARTHLGKFNTTSTVDYSKSVVLDGLKDVTTSHNTAFFGYSAYKPLRTATTVPAKTVSDTDEKQVQKNTLDSADETNTWQITQVIPDEYPEFYYSEAYLTDNIDPAWTVNGVKVTDENGTDVTAWFNNQGAGNDYKLAATAAKLKSADFYGHTYTFTFNAKLKKGYDLSKYLVNGVYTFTNQGSFTTDTGTKPTNKVTTLLKEEQLTLHKVDDAGKALSGVKFALADTEANAKGGKYLKKDADGNVVYPSDSNYSASLADYTGTTDTNGNVTWKGLSSAKNTSHEYYYVELQTSSDHQLLTGIGAAKASATGDSTTVTNKSKVHLPETGSSEQLRWELATLVIGVMAIIAGSGLYAIRKVRKN